MKRFTNQEFCDGGRLGVWLPERSVRFFADAAAANGGGGAGAVASAAAAAAPVAAPAGGGAAPAAESVLSKVFDANGVLKENWHEPFKDVIGDSKYFSTAFKPGRDGVKELVQHVKDLSALKGRALIPKADADDAEWGKVWEAAGGIPKTAEDYGLELEEPKDMPWPAGFKEFLDKSGFIKRVSSELAGGKVPMKLAGAIASARLNAVLERYGNIQKGMTEAREKILNPLLGKVPVDEAIKNGREALARLCEHNDTSPSPLFQGFVDLMQGAGLMDHPMVVGMLHQIATRMNPGKVLVTGTKVSSGANPNTGPGVQPGTDYVSAMAPLTLSQVAGAGRS